VRVYPLIEIFPRTVTPSRATRYLWKFQRGGPPPCSASQRNRRIARGPRTLLMPVIGKVMPYCASQIVRTRCASLYPTGWGEVSNTLFPSFKTYTGAGGRRVACVVSWPARIKDAGAIRRQFMHVTDVMPTLLDLAGAAPLPQVKGHAARPMHGRSFVAALTDADAPAPRTEQYYECWSNRAYYRDGWLARSIQKRGDEIAWDNWTLHDLTRDFSESTDLRANHPEKLAELVAAFDEAAWANQVYPLDNRDRLYKFADMAPWALEEADRPRIFLPGAETVHRWDLSPLIAELVQRLVAAPPPAAGT